MRKDQQFVQNQLMPFLKGIMTDAKESGKSFYKYFGAERKNKEAFTNSKELYRYKYGTNSLFENDAEAGKGFEVLIDELFAKMQREFHYGMHKMYLPDENGSFTNRQEEAIFKLSNSLIEKVNFKEKQAPQEKAEQNEKTIKETSSRLGLARVNIVEPLHLNPETGLIEGKIINVNDPAGSYLNVKIDPADPEIIHFEDDSGRVAFTLNNSDKDVLLFQGRDSRGVMNMAGYTDTENGIPLVAAEAPGSQEPRGSQAKIPQEIKLTLPLQKEAGLEIEETITKEGGQPEIAIKKAVKQAKMPASYLYETAGKERVTEENLKKSEKEKSASAIRPVEQPRPGGESAAMSPRTDEKETEAEQPKKKKSSIGGKLLAIATGGVAVGGGVATGLFVILD